MTIDEKDAGLRGLTDEEVAERVADGRTNANTDVKTKSVRQIVAEHALTLFNGVNLALALLVLATGQYRNMLFMRVVVANRLIGVAQEVRAKRMVDRLTILTQKEVVVVRAAGEDLPKRLAALPADDAAAVCYLNLKSPGAERAYAALRGAGFSFAGFKPLGPGEEFMLLARVSGGWRDTLHLTPGGRWLADCMEL